MNSFKYAVDNKRYHTLNYHFLNIFGEKAYKALINAGMTCPNIDGTCGVGGCSFCLEGSGEFSSSPCLSVTEQLKLESKRITQKYGDKKIIAYFQSNTNTYADVDKLYELYSEAISFQNVVGLSVGTRPDCINEENIKLLSDFSKKTYLTVELGLQTVHDKTALKFNRGYGFETFKKAFNLLKENEIRVCVHLINGLYDETRDDMVESARVLGKMHPDAVKIHLLHILRGTKAERDFQKGKIVPLTKSQYIDIVCRQLEVLPPECVIERITGDGGKENLIVPKWSLNKISVLAGIDKELSARSTYQGDFFADFS